MKKQKKILEDICINNGITPKSTIGLFMPPNFNEIREVKEVLKFFSSPYCQLDINLTYKELCEKVNEFKLELIFTMKEYTESIHEILWSCPSLKNVILLDSDRIITKKNKLMNSKLWEMVSINAHDEIATGAWINSYTRELFSADEMAEYSDNALLKLKPYLNSEAKVLEIGCSSGITMYKISPFTKLYCAIDISKNAIEKNKQISKKLNIKNIELHVLSADMIEEISHTEFDIIIINSVVQLFHSYEYLRDVICGCIKKMKNKGVIFIGDIMDLDLKEDFELSLSSFKKSNPQYDTKLYFENELFIPKRFFKCIESDFKQISEFMISPKIHTLKNELTEYRYDCLIIIDKNIDEDNHNHRMVQAVNIFN